MAIRSIYILVFGFCLCTTGQSAPPVESVYLDGNGSRTAVILCHGRGKHPQWHVVEPLRKGIHSRLGYHTLSLQMPNYDKSWKEYANDFPEAYRRIQAGIDFLRNEKGIKIIYLVGHSMGSRMASAFLAEHPDAGVAGFIGVGMRNNGGRPLDASASLAKVTIPVLDVYGDGGDRKDQQHAWERESLVSASYRQVLIPDANHRFTEHEDELVRMVVDWLSSQAI